MGRSGGPPRQHGRPLIRSRPHAFTDAWCMAGNASCFRAGLPSYGPRLRTRSTAFWHFLFCVLVFTSMP